MTKLGNINSQTDMVDSVNGQTGAVVVAPGIAAGGTTSQKLVKKSGTDYDTQWNPPWGENAYVGTSAPAGTPKVGDLWYDTDDVSTLVLPMSVTNGGTGSSTASGARTNLAVPGIPVPVNQGGTGGIDAAAARLNLGVPTTIVYMASPSLAVPGTGANAFHLFDLTFPRAGTVHITAAIRWYMTTTSTLLNVLLMTAVAASGGAPPTCQQHAAGTGPYPTAAQQGDTTPMVWTYASVPAGTSPFAIAFATAGTTYGYTVYTVQLTATLI